MQGGVLFPDSLFFCLTALKFPLALSFLPSAPHTHRSHSRAESREERKRAPQPFLKQVLGATCRTACPTFNANTGHRASEPRRGTALRLQLRLSIGYPYPLSGVRFPTSTQRSSQRSTSPPTQLILPMLLRCRFCETPAPRPWVHTSTPALDALPACGLAPG